jgi:excisionase family DNA binding protein
MATLAVVRERVLRARAQAVAHHEDEIVRELDEALAELDGGETLLTTSEAAAKLGIRSVNTIKAMVHAGRIHARMVGTHYRIPLTEIERLRGDPTIRGLQASSRVHEQLDAEFGPASVLTDDELQILEDSRPGTLPWQRADAGDRREA